MQPLLPSSLQLHGCDGGGQRACGLHECPPISLARPATAYQLLLSRHLPHHGRHLCSQLPPSRHLPPRLPLLRHQLRPHVGHRVLQPRQLLSQLLDLQLRSVEPPLRHLPPPLLPLDCLCLPPGIPPLLLNLQGGGTRPQHRRQAAVRQRQGVGHGFCGLLLHAATPVSIILRDAPQHPAPTSRSQVTCSASSFSRSICAISMSRATSSAARSRTPACVRRRSLALTAAACCCSSSFDSCSRQQAGRPTGSQAGRWGEAAWQTAQLCCCCCRRLGCSMRHTACAVMQINCCRRCCPMQSIAPAAAPPLPPPATAAVPPAQPPPRAASAARRPPGQPGGGSGWAGPLPGQRPLSPHLRHCEGSQCPAGAAGEGRQGMAGVGGSAQCALERRGS